MSNLNTNTTDLQTILEVANKINTDVTAQTDIIAQIATALEGKAAGGGSNMTVSHDGNGNVTFIGVKMTIDSNGNAILS